MRRSIAGIGRTLVTLGLLILMFVAYQLWGTGILTARAQNDLKRDFARLQAGRDDPVVRSPTTTGAPSRATTTSTTGPPTASGLGDVEGIIRIPRIGLDKAFVEGVGLDQLSKGPGHYPETALPGQFGNAAIAGHRTTWGAPFYRLDELRKGDKIVLETFYGTFTYQMSEPEPWIVKPTDVQVLDPPAYPGVAWLTLTACHPRYSAAQRIVVRATLVTEQSDPPVKATPRVAPRVSPREREDELLSERRSLAAAVGWSMLPAVVGLAWWWAFRRWRHPLTWVVGVVPFIAALWPFYVHLDHAITPFGS